MGENTVTAENSHKNETDNVPVVVKLCGDRPLVWTAEEWLKLRESRICGSLIGVPANLPKQIIENGLPLLLMPEEVSFILDSKLGKVYKYKKERNFPDEKTKKDYENYLTQNNEQQVHYYRKLCREQISERIDSIIEGKRRKLSKKIKDSGEESSEPELDKEALMESELERRLAAATSSLLVEIPSASPCIKEEDLELVEWNFPETPIEKIRYQVYKDLHKKGYSITSGAKFGGDYLAYPGEPLKFHAFYIIKCLEFNQEMSCSELIMNVRLGVFTRKNFVIASIDDEGNILYNTFTWPGKS